MRVKSLSKILWPSSITIAAVGIFWLPWIFFSTVPKTGESYSLGFNNKLATCSLAVAIFIAILARLASEKKQSAYAWIKEKACFIPTWAVAKYEYVVLAVCGLIWSGVIIFWGNYLTDPAWCEGRLIYGIDLLALGKAPYKDFMFTYGPAMLYIPFWISRISLGSISFDQSYLVTLVAFTIIGFCAIFIFVRSLAVSDKSRWIILLISILAWFQLTMGLHYTPLRFFVLPAAIIVMNAVINKVYPNNTAGCIYTAIAALLATFACLSISPEVGIAGAAALIAYGFAAIRSGRLTSGFACLIGCIAILLITLCFFPDYILGVLAYASGAYNFPIFPNLHNIALVLVSLCTIPALIAFALLNPRDQRSPLLLALAIGGGMLLPAALGRCDPGHIFINCAIPLMMMFPATERFGKIYRNGWFLVYIFLYIVLLQISYWSLYFNNFRASIQMHDFYNKNPNLVSTWADQWRKLRASSPHGKDFYWSKVLPFPAELDQFTSSGSVLQADGAEWSLWITRYLSLQKHIPNDYFNAYSPGATTPSQIDRKVEDSGAFEYLLISMSSFAPLQGAINLDAYSKGVSAFLTKLMLYPVNCTAKIQPYYPESQYAARMLNDFEPVAKFNGYLILQKKKPAPLQPAAK